MATYSDVVVNIATGSGIPGETIYTVPGGRWAVVSVRVAAGTGSFTANAGGGVVVNTNYGACAETILDAGQSLSLSGVTGGEGGTGGFTAVEYAKPI